MSATLLRFSCCVKNVPKWHITKQIIRTIASRSDNLSADATSIAQRKIELKEPIGTEKLQNLFDNEILNGDVVPVFKRALLYGNKIAIKDETGEYSYRQLVEAARKLSTELQSSGIMVLFSV